MTREELEALGMTDEELSALVREKLGIELRMSSSDRDDFFLRRARRQFFDHLMRETVGKVNAPSHGERMGPFARDAPAVHASLASPDPKEPKS